MGLRFLSWLTRWRGASAAALLSSVVAPLVLPAWAAWAEESAPRQHVSRARPLAIQLATVARMNVPAGRKAIGAASKPLRAKPIADVVVKRAPVARSVHLQARHKVIKPKLAKLVVVRSEPLRAADIATAIAA